MTDYKIRIEVEVEDDETEKTQTIFSFLTDVVYKDRQEAVNEVIRLRKAAEKTHD